MLPLNINATVLCDFETWLSKPIETNKNKEILEEIYKRGETPKSLSKLDVWSLYTKNKQKLATVKEIIKI